MSIHTFVFKALTGWASGTPGEKLKLKVKKKKGREKASKVCQRLVVFLLRLSFPLYLWFTLFLVFFTTQE